MKIIIEGCDGTGKTTLAKKLAERYGLDIIHMTNQDSNTFGFYYHSIGKENVVWDRNMIGEIIYPSIFDRKANIDYIDLKYLIERARKAGTIILVLTATNDVIFDRLMARGNEMVGILQNYKEINRRFCNIAILENLPLIDTTTLSFEEICKRYIDKGEFNNG